MKKRILIALTIAVVIITIAMPLTAFAYDITGTIDAPRYSGGNMIKYTFINGANISLYYITGSGGTYYSYPFGSPNQPGSGDTPPGCPIQLWDWSNGSIGNYNSTIYPRIGGAGNDYSNWGPIYTVGGITNSKVEVAVAIVLSEGYDRSNAYTGYGIDWQHAQYATNLCLQNLAALCTGGSDPTAYSPYGGLSVNGGTAQFCYQLGQDARRYLANSSPQQLIATPSAQNVTIDGNYYNATVTISLPQTVGGANRSTYYTNNYTLDTSGFPSGTIVSGYTGIFDANGNQTIHLKIPISGNSAKTFTGRATGTYINRSANVDLYNVGWSSGQYTRQVASDERVSIANNNISTPTISFSVTTPNKADLAITSLTADKSSYNANDTATITAVVQNVGSQNTSATCIGRITYNSLQLTSIDMADKTIPILAPGTSTTLTYKAKINVFTQATSIPVTVSADATSLLDEITESNNSKTISLNAEAAEPDFGCDFTAYDYIAGQDAIVTVTVNNTGAIGNPNVPVRLKVGDTLYNTTIPAPIGSNLAVFRVTMPNISGQVTITAAVDPDNTISEYNENNNTATHTAQVTILHTPQQIDTLDSGLEQTYLNKNKQIPDTPNNPDSTTHTWQEWRYEGGNYVLHTYTATLSMTFQVKSDSRITGGNTIESGFGLEQSAVATLTTNYDHPEKLVGIQNMWLTYPETCYGLDTGVYTGYYETMISSSPGVLSNAWSYPNNPNSVKNLPLHYVPLWYPDGRYTVLCTAFGAWSPNGQMYADLTGNVTVSGNMYDRITAVGY